MKTRVLLSVSLMVSIIGGNAQNSSMILTFTADYNYLHVPLDSILIENITQGTDTVLYAPDTVLIFDVILGMEEVKGFYSNSFTLSQNYPNPMEGKTTIGIRLSESRNILVEVCDVIGREVVSQEFQLEQGSHSFTFYPGKESLYFFTARSNEHSRTIKMFNSPSNLLISGYCKLEYKGQQDTKVVEYKSGIALNDFVFYVGDLLKLTSFTILGQRVLTCSPTGDKTCYFHYTGTPAQMPQQ